MTKFQFFAGAVLCLSFFAITPSSAHTLRVNDNFTLNYQLTGDNKTIEFEIVAKTKGWVGLGFNENSADMKGADIVLAYVVNSNQTTLTDNYGNSTNNTRPIPDPADFNKDYKLISGSDDNTTTTVKFSRLLNTTDKDYDVVIQNKPINVIWAYGEGDDVNYHQGLRGSVSINLMADPDGDSGAGAITVGVSTILLAVVASLLKSFE